MSAPFKPWESTKLNNSANLIHNNPNPAIPQVGNTRPALPPRPVQNSYGVGVGGLGSGYNSYSSNYGGYNNMPYRSSLYSPYGGYSSLGGYGGYGGMGTYGGYGMGGYGPYRGDNAEDRFTQYVEESSRNTFSNIESVVRAFSSISMMLDNTFFALTSSFRAVLSVAENFGRLRTVFGQIWYSISIFRLFSWLHRKIRSILGLPVTENLKQVAWDEAAGGVLGEAGGTKGSSWPVIGFLGAIVAIPYLINKLLPKYEDKLEPEKWKSSGIRAKVAFDFVSTTPREMTIHTNDEVLVAPKHLQEELRVFNTGWAYATCNGRSGMVPLNYLVTMKSISKPLEQVNNSTPSVVQSSTPQVTRTKKVSFGENQIIEIEPLSDFKPSVENLSTNALSNSQTNSEAPETIKIDATCENQSVANPPTAVQTATENTTESAIVAS